MLSSFKALASCPMLVMTLVIPHAVIAQTEEPASLRNSYTSEKDVRQGGLYVNGYCSRCHGKDASGGKGPNLTIGRFRHGNTDEALFKNIQNGIRGTGMPALPLRDIPIWQIIAFLRSKQNESNFERPDGVVEQGRRLFVQHKCDSCHWTRRSGGRLGPDLSQWRGDMEFFRRAMRHPDEEIDPKYQRVSARLEDGRLLVGRRLYDDGYFLLLIDEQQNLHTIPLFEIEELVLPKQSLMASYANELDEQALRDLAAYTYSLSEKTMP